MNLSPEDPRAALDRLTATLRARRRELPAGSYATQLFQGGLPKIGAKLREELEELLAVATPVGQEPTDHLQAARVIHEGADLLFHLLALLETQGSDWTDLAAELARREGMSGLDAARRRSP